MPVCMNDDLCQFASRPPRVPELQRRMREGRKLYTTVGWLLCEFSFAPPPQTPKPAHSMCVCAYGKEAGQEHHRTVTPKLHPRPIMKEICLQFCL